MTLIFFFFASSSFKKFKWNCLCKDLQICCVSNFPNCAFRIDIHVYSFCTQCFTPCCFCCCCATCWRCNWATQPLDDRLLVCHSEIIVGVMGFLCRLHLMHWSAELWNFRSHNILIAVEEVSMAGTCHYSFKSQAYFFVAVCNGIMSLRQYDI